MKLTIADILADIAIIDARGDRVRGIQMGRVAFNTICDSLGMAQTNVLKGGRLDGYSLGVIETLGETVNYQLEPHKHDPAWVSREELNTGTMVPEKQDGYVLVYNCSTCGRQAVYEIFARECE